MFLLPEFTNSRKVWRRRRKKMRGTSGLAAAVEQVRTADQVERLLALWRGADHVSLLALPDLTGVAVYCAPSEDAAVLAELFFDRYEGDWNALLQTLFSADIKKVSHHVKDLMRLLRENNLPAEGFVFDTALAAYLLDATAGSYELERLFVAYFNEELPQPFYREKDAFSMLGDTVQAEARLKVIPRQWRLCMSRCAKNWSRRGCTRCFTILSCPCARCWQIWNVQAAGWMRWS